MRRRDSSFSRSGYGGSRQDEVGRTIFERVDQLLNSRWKLLCPFDVVEEPERDLWPYAMTREQHSAWALLERDKYFEDSIMRIFSFDIENKAAGYVIRIPTSSPVPRWPVLWHNLPTELMQRIHHWMLQSRAYRDEYHTIRDKVKALMMLCTTPGQIERTWPELMGFMPGHVKDARLEKKARSPYPYGVLDDQHRVKPEWSPETLSWYDTAIAESLILPLYKHPLGAPAYPEILDLT